ncbi:MAG: hypothetical protein OEW15_02015, partial [Nitrospirota bacterium]|nr:hypothetical protein [Nitrospirota bacterium]
HGYAVAGTASRGEDAVARIEAAPPPDLILMDMKDAQAVPGAGFLHATLETRDELLAKKPKKAELMVRIMRRTLEWMAKAPPDEIVWRAEVRGPVERRWLLHTLRKYPHRYSPDGRFSEKQLEETGLFFREANPDQSGFVLKDMIVDLWSGSRG